MTLQILGTDDETVVAQIDTVPRQEMGSVYSLALFLFCLSPQYRDAMISYIISRGDIDVDAMAKIAGCAPSTIRTRLQVARRTFREAVRDFGGCFPVRDDMAVSLPAEDASPDVAEFNEDQYIGPDSDGVSGNAAISRDVPRKMPKKWWNSMETKGVEGGYPPPPRRVLSDRAAGEGNRREVPPEIRERRGREGR